MFISKYQENLSFTIKQNKTRFLTNEFANYNVLKFMFVKSGNKNLRHREIINYKEETFSFS